MTGRQSQGDGQRPEREYFMISEEQKRMAVKMEVVTSKLTFSFSKGFFGEVRILPFPAENENGERREMR